MDRAVSARNALALFEFQPDLRALLMLSEVPAKHMTFPISDFCFYPHLRPGECAVIDLAEREPIHGELFLIAYGSPTRDRGYSLKLCEALYLRESSHWIVRHGLPENCRPWVEGPFGSVEHLAGKLIGRVVGFYSPTPNSGAK